MQTKEIKMMHFVLCGVMIAGLSFILGYTAGSSNKTTGPDTSKLDGKIEEIEKLETSISNWEEIAEIQAEQIESDIKEKRVLEAVIRDLVKENKELKN